METTTISINDLISPTYNPRQISKEEMQKLENSITEFGLVSPIVINLKNNHIIGGNQRFNTLLSINQKKGDFYKELTLIKLGDIGLAFIDEDLTVESEDHEKALNLALNKISGEWDFEKLTVLLDELDLNGFDISLSGFDGLDDLDIDFDEDYDEEYDVEEDDYEEPEDLEVTVKYGDLYQLGEHHLLCGDATSKEDINQLIQDNPIHMILTDPPYGMHLNCDFSRIKGCLKSKGRKTNTSGNKYDNVIGDHEDFKPELINTIFNNFKNTKEVFLFGADYYAELLPNKNDGSWLVWDKRKESQADAIGSEFELIWSKNKHKRRMLRHDWFGFLSSQNQYDARNRVHPTQKPITLLADILKQWGANANNILDLYGGSGSTLIACEQLNRNCYMMELDPYYCQVIINRWETLTGEKATKIGG